MPHHLTFLADGTRHEVTTTALTLRSALEEAGVRLRTQDRVSTNLAARPFDEQVVAVTRVDGKRAVEERPITFDTEKRRSKDLYIGQTEVVTSGPSAAVRLADHDTGRYPRAMSSWHFRKWAAGSRP